MKKSRFARLRLIARDAKSRGRLKEAIDSLRVTPRLNPLRSDHRSAHCKTT